MNAESSDKASFLCSPWSRIPIAPWFFSLLVLAVLAAARYYAVFGPPQARILFLLHALVMWTLPFLLLTRQGRRDIGLCKQGNTLSALALSALAGAVCGLAFFAIGMALYGNSPDNWCLSIRDSFQLKQMLAVMSPAAAFAAITVPAMILTPIGEEILFRGLIQQAFMLRWNAVIATLVNGLAFGLIHLHVHGLWRDAAGFHLRLVSGALMVLLLAGASAVFTLCRQRSGSLWCAMTAHAACNLAMISAVFFRYI
ncbi:MAG: lysostaphin resistance A-like protein [Terracidiphilus sp.]